MWDKGVKEGVGKIPPTNSDNGPIIQGNKRSRRSGSATNPICLVETCQRLLLISVLGCNKRPIRCLSLSVYLCVCFDSFLTVYLSACVLFCLSVYLCPILSVGKIMSVLCFVCLFMSVYMFYSFCLSVCVMFCLYIGVLLYLPVYLPVPCSVCL